MKKILLFVLSTSFLLTGYTQEMPPVSVKELPVLFQQTAAEYRALCYQAFNIARLRIDQLSRRELRKNQLAIVTDLDETILDNSYSEAKLIKEGKEYTPASWKDWTNQSSATTVPGAVEFLNAARAKGITIFYISNRDTGEIQSTLLNLQKLGLPNADSAHLLFLENTSSKESRRLKVAVHYKIIMLLGDNLNDFTSAFEKKSIADRFAETDLAKDEWGKRFIVLPNSTYGEWESALYDYQKGLTPAQKREKRREKMKGY